MTIKLSGIYIYPIKSMGGVSLEKAEVEQRGLMHDRRFLVANSAFKVLTQRDLPKMALFSLKLLKDQLVVNYDENEIEKLHIPLYSQSDFEKRVRVEIWGSSVNALLCGENYDMWFSHILGTQCHLVYMDECAYRKVDSGEGIGNQVSFADSYPLLLTGEASLQNLNTRLEITCPMNRFRANLIFSGGKPFDEDSWEEFEINGIEFSMGKRSARCVVTTIDQKTGKRGKEPLNTLAKFRRDGGEVYFGQYCFSRGYGSIRVGDSINISKAAG